MPRNPECPSPVAHRALFLAVFVWTAATLGAQSDKFNLPVDRAAPGKANQEEGRKILTEFQRAGIAGDYWLSFELRVLPRKGAERSVRGTMWGTRGPDGPLSRLAVENERWLIVSGPRPAAWVATVGAAAQEIPADQANRAIAGTDVTVFELQMPFLYWADFTYEGQAQIRGRPTHSFVMRPPSGQPPPVPGLTGVRILVDVQFGALMQAEELGAGGAVQKTITLLDLKKVKEQYLVKAIDVRDARTRDKTRFAINGAALNLRLPLPLFTAEKLGEEPPTPAADQVERF